MAARQMVSALWYDLGVHVMFGELMVLEWHARGATTRAPEFGAVNVVGASHDAKGVA